MLKCSYASQNRQYAKVNLNIRPQQKQGNTLLVWSIITVAIVAMPSIAAYLGSLSLLIWG